MKLQDALPYMQAGIGFMYDWDNGLYTDEEITESEQWRYLRHDGDYFEYSVGCIRGDKWRVLGQPI
jgi:hypothetical protein